MSSIFHGIFHRERNEQSNLEKQILLLYSKKRFPQLCKDVRNLLVTSLITQHKGINIRMSMIIINRGLSWVKTILETPEKLKIHISFWIYNAIIDGHVDILKYLHDNIDNLSYCFNRNVRNMTLEEIYKTIIETFLFDCIHVNIFRFLLDTLGFEWFTIDGLHNTILSNAIDREYRDVVKFLLEQPISYCNEELFLEKLIEKKDLELAQHFIRNGHMDRDIDVRSYIEQGKLGVVKFHIKYIALTRFKSGPYSREIFSKACSDGDLDIVEYILPMDIFKNTSVYEYLLEAVDKGQINIVKFLMESKRIKNIKSIDSALKKARKKLHWDIEKYILSYISSPPPVI